ASLVNAGGCTAGAAVEPSLEMGGALSAARGAASSSRATPARHESRGAWRREALYSPFMVWVRRRSSRMLSAAVVLGLLAWGHVGHAFCRTTTCAGSSTNAPECEPDLNGCASRGVPLFWPNRCVAMAVQESGSQVLGLDAGEVQALLSLAASQWTGADCLGSTPSLQFITLGAMSCDQVEFHPEGPNANAVFFRDEGWEHGFSTLGLTSVSFAVSTGEIHGADIEFNSTGILDGFAPQLERIVTHELGHVLGLAHSRAAGAIMNERYSVLGMT